MSDNKETERNKFNCPYLACDEMCHYTKCLRKMAKADWLEDKFEQHGFKYPHVVSHINTACTVCHECDHGNRRSNIDSDMLHEKLCKEHEEIFANTCRYSMCSEIDALKREYHALLADELKQAVTSAAAQYLKITEMIDELGNG